MVINYDVFKRRRKQFIATLKERYPQKKGLVVLFANFEHAHCKFVQESSFYYLTGIEEPGVVLVLDLDGGSTLYIPNFGEARAKWSSSKVYNASDNDLKLWGIDSVKELGSLCKGYTFSCLFTLAEYASLIEVLTKAVCQGGTIFTIYPEQKFIDQRLIINRLFEFLPELEPALENILPIIARMRRVKSQDEIEEIYKAVDCTMTAHETAAQLIEALKMEYQIQAGIEFIFTESGGSAAFPSIVATGNNATILHYTENNSLLKNGDLCVVDIGARINHYCADLTRTYPVSGIFSKRQKELYTIVLEAQAYVADLAKPGMWLVNNEQPEKSLHHLAHKFLSTTPYGKYFTHSIGHFLGLDVHDIGDYSEPLQEGDVITIEPGLYIPEEKLGIRIEDNYLIIKDGTLCLSEELPKMPEAIEDLMVQEDVE